MYARGIRSLFRFAGYVVSRIGMTGDLPMGTAMNVALPYEAVQGHCSACGRWGAIHPPACR